MSILDELPNQDKSTDSQQAESSTVAGISIRDSKEKEYDGIHLVFDRSNLTFSLKEVTWERRQDGKPITDYRMHGGNMPVRKVPANQFLSSSRTKDELTGLPLGLTGHLDQVLRFAARLIGYIPKCGSVSAYMRDVLHWLPVP